MTLFFGLRRLPAFLLKLWIHLMFSFILLLFVLPGKKFSLSSIQNFRIWSFDGLSQARMKRKGRLLRIVSWQRHYQLLRALVGLKLSGQLLQEIWTLMARRRKGLVDGKRGKKPNVKCASHEHRESCTTWREKGSKGPSFLDWWSMISVSEVLPAWPLDIWMQEWKSVHLASLKNSTAQDDTLSVLWIGQSC